MRSFARLTSVVQITGFVVAVTVAAGCTVYQSSAREEVNSKGTQVASAQSLLSSDERFLLDSPCDVFQRLTPHDQDELFGSRKISFTNQVSSKTSTCLITNEEASPDQSNLDGFALLSCSWKPVDGSPIATSRADEMQIQMTESDLRDQGFVVLKSHVESGASLRLNCEGYVAAPALVAADDNEVLARPLASKFNEFAHWLEQETLTSTLQR